MVPCMHRMAHAWNHFSLMSVRTDHLFAFNRRSYLFGEVTGGKVFAALFALKGRFLQTTDFLRHRTTRVETATFGNIDRTRQIPRQNDALTMLLDLRIG